MKQRFVFIREHRSKVKRYIVGSPNAVVEVGPQEIAISASLVWNFTEILSVGDINEL